MGLLLSGVQRQASMAALIALYPARLLVAQLAEERSREPCPSALLLVGPDDKPRS